MKEIVTTAEPVLSEPLVERVLVGLGFDSCPTPTLASLSEIYSAWCQKVPFDNVRKLIHVRGGIGGPLPGSSPVDFFEAWLRWGTGGTCWSGAGALHALLTTLGFDSVRGIGTMLAAPDLPPNHGTVMVRFGPAHFLVDGAIQHGVPLPLREDVRTSVDHPASGVQCSLRDGRWHVRWRPLHKLEGFDCRLERFAVRVDEFELLHGKTRGWSPFNYQVCVRTNRGERVIGLAFGNYVTIESDGRTTQRALSDRERRRVLIEEFGIAEELVRQLPQDMPTPPPPWSQTAQEQAQLVIQ